DRTREFFPFAHQRGKFRPTLFQSIGDAGALLRADVMRQLFLASGDVLFDARHLTLQSAAAVLHLLQLHGIDAALRLLLAETGNIGKRWLERPRRRTVAVAIGRG